MYCAIVLSIDRGCGIADESGKFYVCLPGCKSHLSSHLIEGPVSVNSDEGYSIIIGNLATNVTVIKQIPAYRSFL